MGKLVSIKRPLKAAALVIYRQAVTSIAAEYKEAVAPIQQAYRDEIAPHLAAIQAAEAKATALMKPLVERHNKAEAEANAIYERTIK